MSTPEKKPTPREEMEMRLTALLMGELPPEEAAALEAQVAADPALATLKARLRKAIELLREASIESEAPASETPVQLSSERRARLLAHFQTPRPNLSQPRQPETIIQPSPTGWNRDRDWTWVLPLGIAATVVGLIAIGIGGIVPTTTVTQTPDFAASTTDLRVTVDKEAAAPEAAPDVTKWNAHAYKLEPMAPPAPMAAPAAGRIAGVTTGSAAAPKSAAPSQLAPSKLSTMAPAIKAPAEPNYTTALAFGTASTAPAAYSDSKSVDNLAETNAPAPSTIYLGRATADAAFDNAKEEAKPGFATDVNGREELAKSGSGSLVLKGANTYSGGTTISGGTTQMLGDGFATGVSIPNQSTSANAFAGSGGAGKRQQATRILEDLTVVDPAIDQLAIESKKASADAPIDTKLGERTLSITGDGGKLVAGKDVSAGNGTLSLNDISRATPALREKTRNTTSTKTPEQVKQLFIEAQGLYDTGRFALAKKRAEQILTADPNNIAARRFEEKTDRAMSDYGIAAYNETRADATAKSNMASARPTRRFNAQNKDRDGFTNHDEWRESEAGKSAERIRSKLDSIVIPKLELRNATVREAIDYLKKKSVEADGTSPAGERGANIVLKTENQDKEAAAALGAPTGSATDQRITVSLTNIPLTEALKYVTGQANLKFKVEPYAVAVVPITENTDVLITKEWKVPADLIPHASGSDPNSPVDRETVKNWLIANGLSFNGNSSAILIKNSNRLIVRNTQDQLDLVDNVVKAAADDQAAKAAKAAATSTAPIPQPEIPTSENAFSTFSLNVSDVSFKLAAASLEQGHMPDPASVRSEEFINAFNYRDPEPAPGAPLAFASERARYPFAQNRDLLRFSVKTAAAGRQAGRPLNIVLLLDKSGSMERADRVNIVHEALRILATQLQPQDKLSIVTFARTPRLWADGVAGDKVNDTIARVNEITPEGGTNLEAALDLGYETARRHFTPESVNRVVLFTDGAANLGDVNPEALTKKVEAQRKQGIALDCFGIGWEGYNDNLLEQLTRNADGRYGFINTPEDAASNFATQLAGALQVAASDVKVQVEFNPRRVKAYRQIGYATHQLTKEQFRDNTVNAAQIGAAESGNALYVVEIDPRGEGDLAKVHVRFRVPGTSDYRQHEWPVPFTGEAQPLEQSSSALRLAGAASAFSEMLAASPYATEVTSDRLLNILNGVPPIYGADPRPTKLEWMIRQARSLSGR